MLLYFSNLKILSKKTQNIPFKLKLTLYTQLYFRNIIRLKTQYIFIINIFLSIEIKNIFFFFLVLICLVTTFDNLIEGKKLIFLRITYKYF